MNDTEKLEQIRQIILEWTNKKGHDRCWYYPELFKKIAEVIEIPVKQSSELSREEFEEGCRGFQDELFN